MADLTITAANVKAGSNASVDRTGLAGAAVAAGQPVYWDGSRWQLADDNSVTAAARVAGGIALNGASTDQPLAVLTGGDITIGATLTAGSVYYLSATAGGICPAADLATGQYPCIIGIAKSTTVLNVEINSAGVSL